jgi:hypothetical protein
VTIIDTRTALKRWIEGYTQAWLKHDVEKIVALFSEKAIYSSHPFRDRYVGRAAIREYTTWAFSTEEEIYSVKFGQPLVEGSRAVVEYWTTMKERGKSVTLAGSIFIEFGSDGFCTELREYWDTREGIENPPLTWGWRS